MVPELPKVSSGRTLNIFSIVVLIVSGVALVGLGLMSIFVPGVGGSTEAEGAFALVMAAFFFVVTAIVLESLGNCHYCSKPVKSTSDHMIVAWPESTKHSGQKTTAKAVMHMACHNAAPPEQKFRFPVPEFKDIKI
jgi:hypothetical protein